MLAYFFRARSPNVCLAASLANPSNIPELLMTASGQSFSAACRNSAKSSALIFTFTCTVRFPLGCMPHVSSLVPVLATILLVLFVPMKTWALGLSLVPLLACSSSPRGMQILAIKCSGCKAAEDLSERSWEAGETKTCRRSEDIDRQSGHKEESMLLCDDGPSALVSAVGLEAWQYKQPKPDYADRAKEQGTGIRRFLRDHARTFPVSFRGPGTRDPWINGKGYDTYWVCTKKPNGEINCQ